MGGMSFDHLVARMKQIPLKELRAISEKAGVPYSTALKIRGGFSKNPGIRTVLALEPFFLRRRRSL